VVVLASLTPFAYRGVGWMRPIAYAFGIVMAGNGLLHLAGSVYVRKAMPGVYSAPLLLAAAFQTGFASLEGRLLARIGILEGRFGTLEGRLVRWMFLFWAASLGTVLALR